MTEYNRNHESHEAFEMEKFFEQQLERFENKFSFFNRMITLAIASVSLIAALAWDEALKQIFDHLFGGRETISSALAYAVVVTILAAIISVTLGRGWFKKNE